MRLLGLAEHAQAQLQSPALAQRPCTQRVQAVRRRARTSASPGNLEAWFVGARARSSSTPADGAGQTSLLERHAGHTGTLVRACSDGRHR